MPSLPAPDSSPVSAAESIQIEYQETEKEINRIALVSSIVISLLGITTGIIILKRKRS